MKIPCCFPAKQGNFQEFGDEFARDCLLQRRVRQTPVREVMRLRTALVVKGKQFGRAAVNVASTTPCELSLLIMGMGAVDSLPPLRGQALQIFWSVTAIMSLLVMIFILTRE